MTLQPGQHVDEGSLSAEVRLVRNGRGEQRVVLHFEHRTGATILPLPPEQAKVLFEQGLRVARLALGEPAEGLVVARADELPKANGQG